MQVCRWCAGAVVWQVVQCSGSAVWQVWCGVCAGGACVQWCARLLSPAFLLLLCLFSCFSMYRIRMDEKLSSYIMDTVSRDRKTKSFIWCLLLMAYVSIMVV